MMERPGVRDPLDTTTEVETPEHVRFRYHVAGPARRGLAYLLDALIRGAILLCFTVIAGVAGLASGSAIAQAGTGVILLVAFVLEWGYYVFWEVVWNGATPGKRAFRLRVVTEGGYPLRFFDSLLRNLLRGADFLPLFYALGALVMGSDRRFRRLGDLVAGTMVIAEDRHAVTDALTLDPPPTAKELARLPQRVPLSGDELEAVELFLRRGARLPRAREEELAEMVAPIFARRMGLRMRESAPRLLALLHHRAHQKGG
jgi:uncharacterized RDD family membrane protein YckC